MRKKIRVLVAEDSLTVRKRIVEALESDPECEVIGEAADGRTAIDLCQKLRPDVITLDMVMPRMTGLAATEHIMAYCPTPILIVSSSVNRGEVMNTLDALAAGAVDVLDKPGYDAVADDWDKKLLSTVKIASRIKVITHVRGRLRSSTNSSLPGQSPAAAPPSQGVYPLDPIFDRGVVPASPPPLGGSSAVEAKEGLRAIAIGASTGGPGAVALMLKRLPRNFPLPILLVLHIGKPFGLGFAEWLGNQIQLPVALPEDGEPLPRRGKSKVILAPPDRHLVLRDGRLHLTLDPERHSCRPSVDVLFESVAKELGNSSVGCLLTGMGRDGAEGLLAMKRAGAITLAQDESTSVVFGMPREAIRLGAAGRVLPIHEFEAVLSALARGSERTTPREEP